MSLLTIFLAPPERFPSSSVSCVLSLCSHGKLLSSLSPRGRPSPPRAARGSVCHTTGQSASRLEHDSHIFIVPAFLKSRARPRKARKRTCRILSINKSVEKKFPEADILFIFSIQNILMPNSYTDKEKQRIQGLCSYGIVAAIVPFGQALSSSNRKSGSVFHTKQCCSPNPFTVRRTSHVIQLAFGK